MLDLLRLSRRVVKRIVQHGRPIILMYHRVARLSHDPWRLAVSPEHFAEQIECLTRVRRVVPLRKITQALADGYAPKGLAAVTFDDGYFDVLAEANPILERFDCPATAFLTTGAIGSGREFWWDTLVRILFEVTTLPKILTLEISGSMHCWHIGDSADIGGANNSDLRVLSRTELHITLWRLLRALDSVEREQQLEILATWAGANMTARRADIAMSAAEVRQLADGLFEIGAHTVTHPSLPALDSTVRRAEIEGSRRACQELVRTDVDSFAYPYGDLDKDSVVAVREAGFTIACCTESGTITPHSCSLRLPRVDIGNWNGSEFGRRLSMDFNTP